MDRLIYTAMTGANAAAQRQAVLSNNLANASTNGFRPKLIDLPRRAGAGRRCHDAGAGGEATAGYQDAPDPAQRTDRTLDAMTKGNAWFAVQALDGVEAYTRSGSFEVHRRVTGHRQRPARVCPTAARPITVPPGAEVTIGQ